MFGKKLVFDQACMKSISCKEAVEYILKHEEQKLSFLQRMELWRHLAMCSLCKIFAAQNSEINQVIKQRKSNTHGLSEQDKEKIIRSVLNDQE